MKKIIFFISLVGIFLFTGHLQGLANEGKPVHHIKLRYMVTAVLLSDSLPVTVARTAKTPDSTIREVPKARKQQVPIPVSTRIKPIKVIKPIIKPIIKVLH